MTTIDLISLLCSLGAIAFSVITYVSSIIHDRKAATLQAYNRLQEQALDQLQVYMPKDLREIVKNRRSEEFKQLGSYLARIEHFAVGVKQNIYDLNTVYELSHGFLDGSMRCRMEILIERKDKGFQEEFYQNIRWLLLEMDKKTEKRKQNN